MGRRRKRSPLRRLKAWPLLLLLAAVYWGKQHLGISEISDLNSLSKAVLPIAVALFAVGAAGLLLKLVFRTKKKEKTGP